MPLAPAAATAHPTCLPAYQLAAEENPDDAMVTYPRIVSAFDLLQESDCESVFCGPPSDGEAGCSAHRAFSSVNRWSNVMDYANKGKMAPRSSFCEESRPRALDGLIAPRGELKGECQKFVCLFYVGLEDDQEFCLVKRLLGKGGKRMRKIAEDCSAKVRLRGIGSGFLEGTQGKEANMPLQLHVSCTNFDCYCAAVQQAAVLLKEVYSHYQRFAKAKGLAASCLDIDIEELRRDDLGIDVLAQKAQRSRSQRDEDRRKRLWRRMLNEVTNVGTCGTARTSQTSCAQASKKPDVMAFAARAPLLQPALPGGCDVPVTPAGRRAAAKVGGAALAALCCAHARELDRTERLRRQEESKWSQNKARKQGNRDKADARMRGSWRQLVEPTSLLRASNSHVDKENRDASNQGYSQRVDDNGGVVDIASKHVNWDARVRAADLHGEKRLDSQRDRRDEPLKELPVLQPTFARESAQWIV